MPSTKDFEEARQEVRTALDCLAQAESKPAQRSFLVWKAYARTEMAVLIIKLAVGEDVLLEDLPRMRRDKDAEDRGPEEMLNDALSNLSGGRAKPALASLREARDALTSMVKSTSRA